jgi:hypothetical protein
MSVPTFDEANAKAREGSPFSNGFEGEHWMANNCHRCIHDKPARDGSDPTGCPLILVAYLGKTPAEWLEKNRSSLGDQYTCLYFRDENDGPGPHEPTPIPDPPGQLTLCPRGEFERPARMFADTMPQEVSVHG